MERVKISTLVRERFEGMRLCHLAIRSDTKSRDKTQRVATYEKNWHSSEETATELSFPSPLLVSVGVAWHAG